MANKIRRLSEETDSDSDEVTTVKRIASSEDDGLSSRKDGRDIVWTNSDLSVVEPPIDCYIPYSLVMRMRTLETVVNSRLEYGAFLKGTFDESLHVGEDFYVPDQIVTGVTIDFREENPEGYNGVIHRHPGGCTSFSGTDKGSINQNYDFSLLYVNGDIKTGIINIKAQGLRIQLPLRIKVVHPLVEGMEELKEKIQERKVTPIKSGFGRVGFGTGSLSKPSSPLSGFGKHGVSWRAEEELSMIPHLFGDDETGEDDEMLVECHQCKETYPKDQENCPYCGVLTEDNLLTEADFIQQQMLGDDKKLLAASNEDTVSLMNDVDSDKGSTEQITDNIRDAIAKEKSKQGTSDK